MCTKTFDRTIGDDRCAAAFHEFRDCVAGGNADTYKERLSCAMSLRILRSSSIEFPPATTEDPMRNASLKRALHGEMSPLVLQIHDE